VNRLARSLQLSQTAHRTDCCAIYTHRSLPFCCDALGHLQAASGNPSRSGRGSSARRHNGHNTRGVACRRGPLAAFTLLGSRKLFECIMHSTVYQTAMHQIMLHWASFIIASCTVQCTTLQCTKPQRTRVPRAMEGLHWPPTHTVPLHRPPGNPLAPVLS